MTSFQRDIISYSFVAVASAALLLWIIPAFSPEYPGYGAPPTLVPNIAAGFMLALSILGLLQTALRKNSAENSQVSGVCWLHLAKFFIPCALMMPGMQVLGFIPAGLLFLLAIQLACGQRKIIPLACIAGIPVLIVYVLMRFALGVPMP